jgi:DMSO/TMAO reductase YedYZ molybdopterin-dependent catalytic subunit
MPVRTFGLTHLALGVKDPGRAFEFYRKVFGMVAVYRQPDFIQAQTPGARDLAPAVLAQSAAPALTVAGDVTTPLTLTLADLKAMPRTKIEIKEEARTIVYEGVLLGEILKRAGAPMGEALRGNALTTYVTATAKDGYQVVFSLAELDPEFSKSEIAVVDLVDGKPLFDYQGPLRVVAPKDTRGARSIRMLEKLDVVRLKK